MAEEVETNLTNVMTAITDQEDTNIFNEDKTTTIIQSVFKSEVSDIIKQLQDKEIALVQETNKCKLLNEKLQTSIDSVVKLHQTLTQSTEKLTNKYNYLIRNVEEMKETIKHSSDENAEFTNHIHDKIYKIKTLTDTHKKRESYLETLD